MEILYAFGIVAVVFILILVVVTLSGGDPAGGDTLPIVRPDGTPLWSGHDDEEDFNPFGA